MRGWNRTGKMDVVTPVDYWQVCFIPLGTYIASEVDLQILAWYKLRPSSWHLSYAIPPAQVSRANSLDAWCTSSDGHAELFASFRARDPIPKATALWLLLIACPYRRFPTPVMRLGIEVLVGEPIRTKVRFWQALSSTSQDSDARRSLDLGMD